MSWSTTQRPVPSRLVTDSNGQQQPERERTTTTAPGPHSAHSANSSNGRSSSHMRSQSLSEHAQPDSPPISTSPPELVRRHHTVSSSSRLVRLERSRARVALDTVGLSETDKQFYQLESPVDGPVGAWSDLGHAGLGGGARGSTLSTLGAHSRTTSSGSGSTAGAGWGASEAVTSPTTMPFFSSQDTPKASTFEISQPTSGAAKRSSFVVVRGGKGDSALTERRAVAPGSQQALSPPRAARNITPPRPNLEQRNSLKPFLEADGEGPEDQEEWERSLQDERVLELQRADERSATSGVPLSTPPLSHSASFSARVGAFDSSPNQAPPHTRANTLSHTHSIASVTASEAWNGTSDDSRVLRRHHSLDFRSDGLGQSSPELGWAGHDRFSPSEDSVIHAQGFGVSSGGFASSRAGGSGPPSLNLHGSSSPHSSLSHSNSLNSHRGGNLSHSNSLTSSSHHSHGHGGALSPSGVFPRSPWSPTVEETKQLGMGTVVGTPPVVPGLSRGGSASSRGSSAGLYPGGDDVGRLGDDMAALEVTSTSAPEHDLVYSKPPTPPGLDVRAAIQASSYGGSQVDGSVRQLPVRSMTTNAGNRNTGVSPNRRLPPLTTNPDALASLSGAPKAQGPTFGSRQGPASAAAYVPPIGHSHLPNSFMPSIAEPLSRGNFTAAPGGGADWMHQKEMLVGGGAVSAFPTLGANPLAEAWPAGGGFGVGLAMQQQQQIQILQSQMQAALQAMDMMKAQGHSLPPGFNGTLNAATPTGRPFGSSQQSFAGSSGVTPTGPPFTQQSGPASATADSPIDIPTLIATKGYNPQNFDLRPQSARFFVIKSYTEEDVHKSLKYEIWASTDLGNKRLDRAFRESADKGPIYLFFSVNGSGHFAGMAQMLTPVDYAMSSNVWASDKWKGVLKVKWIYIKDVPLASLRHIRLSNTPENKPVTSSRDTQEVPYDAGIAVLGILASYNSRTSLLQDFAYYNSNESTAATLKTTPPTAAPHQPHYAPRPPSVPPHQPPSNPYQFQQQRDSSFHPQQAPPYHFQDMSHAPSPLPQMVGGRRYFGGNGTPGNGY
ncbi:YTH domain-containing family protein, partial [Phenoliferia sp. Uapishka_3]